MTYDKVTFGDFGNESYSVFAIHTDVHKDHLSDVPTHLYDVPNAMDSLHLISANSKPSRSKIIEVLYRFYRNIYENLVDTGLIPNIEYHVRSFDMNIDQLHLEQLKNSVLRFGKSVGLEMTSFTEYVGELGFYDLRHLGSRCCL